MTRLGSERFVLTAQQQVDSTLWREWVALFEENLPVGGAQERSNLVVVIAILVVDGGGEKWCFSSFF